VRKAVKAVAPGLVFVVLSMCAAVGQGAGPWLPTSWGAWSPWNASCPCVSPAADPSCPGTTCCGEPTDTSCRSASAPCRSPAGCTELALAQLLCFHGAPGCSYPYPIVLNAGNSILTRWGTHQSSACFDDIVAALVGVQALPWGGAGLSGVWGYPSAAYCSLGAIAGVPPEYTISYTALFGRIQKNLNSGLPVLLSLVMPGMTAGHTVICDGYAGTSPSAGYHLLMGWGGVDDGFYSEAQLQGVGFVTPGLGIAFSGVDAAILDIDPNGAVVSTFPECSPVANFTIETAASPLAPPAYADAQRVQAGLAVNVDASYRGLPAGHFAYDPNGFIASYDWDFGDGIIVGGATASHTYAAPGSYSITLTVTDNMGIQGVQTKQIAVW
jgi:hypothetical protein